MCGIEHTPANWANFSILHKFFHQHLCFRRYFPDQFLHSGKSWNINQYMKHSNLWMIVPWFDVLELVCERYSKSKGRRKKTISSKMILRICICNFYIRCNEYIVSRYYTFINFSSSCFSNLVWNKKEYLVLNSGWTKKWNRNLFFISGVGSCENTTFPMVNSIFHCVFSIFRFKLRSYWQLLCSLQKWNCIHKLCVFIYLICEEIVNWHFIAIGFKCVNSFGVTAPHDTNSKNRAYTDTKNIIILQTKMTSSISLKFHIFTK